MEIIHEIGKSAFQAVENEQNLGLLTYTTDNNNFIINHTEVSEGHEGKGIGKALVKEAVGYAKVNGLMVIPHCSYAKSVIDKDPHLGDDVTIEVKTEIEKDV